MGSPVIFLAPNVDVVTPPHFAVEEVIYFSQLVAQAGISQPFDHGKPVVNQRYATVAMGLPHLFPHPLRVKRRRRRGRANEQAQHTGTQPGE